MHLTWQPSRDLDGPPILTSVDPAESAELRKLAKGRQVLEIGSAHGYSSVVMGLAGAEHITAVDPHIITWLGDTLPIMQQNLEAYGVDDKVEIFQAYSYDALPRLIAEERKYGLIFIDGDHMSPAVENDIANALELIEPGGVICCHDFLEHCCCPEVMHAVNRCFPEGPTRIVGTMSVHERP